MPDILGKNLISIDIARAVAALGVFAFHQRTGLLMDKYIGISWFNFIDTFGAYYAVPLFFLISGYCIHLSNIKYIKGEQKLPLKEYFKRRFSRIYPAYLVAILLGILSYHIVYHTNHISVKSLFTHLFLLQSFSDTYFLSINLTLWTISVEVALYILYPLFYSVRLKYSLKYALLLAFIASCISITYYINKNPLTLPDKYFVFNLWFAWCVGAYIADKKSMNEGDLKKPVYKIIYILILLGVVLLKVFYQSKLEIITYQFNILLWTAPLIFLLNKEEWFRRKQSIPIKALTYIGLSSYSLYLFHMPLITLKNYYAHELLPVQFQLTGMIAGILIILLICWFSYLYIEKPFMRKDSALKNV